MRRVEMFRYSFKNGKTVNVYKPFKKLELINLEILWGKSTLCVK